MKVIISETQYNRLIDNFITYLIEPHDVKTHPKFPNSIYWVKDGEVIVEIENSRLFWLHYRIWNQISDQFGFEHNETKSVIKTWLKQHYGFGNLIPEDAGVLVRYFWKDVLDYRN